MKARFSLDVKSLYTNVPVHEAIEIACKKIYEGERAKPNMTRSTLKRMMELAVADVWFRCGDHLYIQKDGVAMGAAMAVILANLWLEQFEITIASDSKTSTEMKPFCGKGQKIVTKRGYPIQCTMCRSWLHRACSPFSVQEIKSMPKSEWHCGCPIPGDQNEFVIFARFVDGIIRSARKDISDILKKVNSLHPILQFTIEYPDNGSIPFLDMNVRLDDRKLSTAWYQKSSDTGILLSFRSSPTLFRLPHSTKRTSSKVQFITYSTRCLRGNYFTKAWRKR